MFKITAFLNLVIVNGKYQGNYIFKLWGGGGGGRIFLLGRGGDPSAPPLYKTLSTMSRVSYRGGGAHTHWTLPPEFMTAKKPEVTGTWD